MSYFLKIIISKSSLCQRGILWADMWYTPSAARRRLWVSNTWVWRAVLSDVWLWPSFPGPHSQPPFWGCPGHALLDVAVSGTCGSSWWPASVPWLCPQWPHTHCSLRYFVHISCLSLRFHLRAAETAAPKYAFLAKRLFWACYFKETTDIGKALTRD